MHDALTDTTTASVAESATFAAACSVPVHEAVLRELHGLPDDHRQILLLKLFDRMSLAEISNHTGIDLETVRTRATCGIRTLAGRFRMLGML